MSGSQEHLSVRGELASADEWTGAPSVLDLWRVDLAAPTLPDESLLSDDEAARAQRRHPSGRAAYVAARCALRVVLSRYAGRAPGALAFRYGEHGRPELCDAPGLDFNLSHSGDFALIAAGHGLRVGVDLQRVEPDRDLQGVARRFFSPVEREALEGLESAALVRAFFRTWTCKEAYLKGLGTSIAVLPSDRFGFSFEGGLPRLLHTDWPGGHGDWEVAEVAAPDGYAAAVCWSGPRRGGRVYRLGAAS